MTDARIRPCEKCGGPIGPDFYVIKMSQVVVDYDAVSRYQGLALYFKNLELADVFTPDVTLSKVVSGPDANRWQELVICRDCMFHNDILPLLFAKGGA